MKNYILLPVITILNLQKVLIYLVFLGKSFLVLEDAREEFQIFVEIFTFGNNALLLVRTLRPLTFEKIV